jgi:hypothetical protein
MMANAGPAYIETKLSSEVDLETEEDNNTISRKVMPVV